MVGIHEDFSTWNYWDEYVQYLINKNKSVQRIREKLKKERAKKLTQAKNISRS